MNKEFALIAQSKLKPLRKLYFAILRVETQPQADKLAHHAYKTLTDIKDEFLTAHVLQATSELCIHIDTAIANIEAALLRLKKDGLTTVSAPDIKTAIKFAYDHLKKSYRINKA